MAELVDAKKPRRSRVLNVTGLTGQKAQDWIFSAFPQILLRPGPYNGSGQSKGNHGFQEI